MSSDCSINLNIYSDPEVVESKGAGKVVLKKGCGTKFHSGDLVLIARWGKMYLPWYLELVQWILGKITKPFCSKKFHREFLRTWEMDTRKDYVTKWSIIKVEKLTKSKGVLTLHYEACSSDIMATTVYNCYAYRLTGQSVHLYEIKDAKLDKVWNGIHGCGGYLGPDHIDW